MDSVGDTAEAVGCPIRKSTDQSLLAAPHGLSQRAASFIASQCQGIHQMPFIRLFSALTRRVSRHLRMRHAQEKAHKGPTPARTHPAKMHRHDPTSSLPLPRRRPCRVILGHSFSSHVKDPISALGQISAFSLIGYRRLPRSLKVTKVTVRHSALPPGGGGRDRTDDLMLAKHALSQLSYAPTGKDREEQWWAREDLNFRPHAYQARALTN